MNRNHLLILCAVFLCGSCVVVRRPPADVPPPASAVREPSTRWPPVAVFQGAKLWKQDLHGAEVGVEVGVHVRGTVGEGTYTLTVSMNGKRIVRKGKASQSSSSSSFHVVGWSTPIRWADLGTPLRRWAHYRVRGSLIVSSHGERTTVPFDHSGRLRVVKSPGEMIQPAELAEVQLPFATVVVPVQVDDPNPFPITLAGWEGDLRLNGTPVGRFTHADPHRLGYVGKKDVVLLTFHVPYGALAGAALMGKVSTLKFDGELNRGSEKVQLNFKTRFPLHLQAPALTFGTPRVEGGHAPSARIHLPIQVKNPNGFPLPRGGVRGVIQIAGRKVGTVSAKALGPIEGGRSARVEVPLALRPSEVERLLHGKPLRVEFHGELQSGSAVLKVSFTQEVSLRREASHARPNDRWGEAALFH